MMGQDLAKNSRVFDKEATNKRNTGSLSISKNAAKFTESEMRSLVQVFNSLAALSPKDNYIDKATFEHYFPLGGILGGRLFASFDRNKNGVIDLQEFLDGMSICLRGSSDDKYQVAFDMFNLDGTEGVSAVELYIVLKSVLLAASRQVCSDSSQYGYVPCEEEELDQLAQGIVQDAFSQRVADLDKDDKLTLSVFNSWMESHPFVLNSIFGQACLKDKRVQYIRLGDEQKDLQPSKVPAGKSLTSVRKQTWVSPSFMTNTKVESVCHFNGSYVSADYLWSPMFPQTGVKPCTRSKLAACLLYDCLYVYGGRGACTSLKDLWRYDIGDNAWLPVTVKGDCRPPSLQEHTISTYKGKLVLFGGEFTSSNETPLWVFDLGSCTWNKPVANQKGPVNRKSHSAVLSGDCLYIFGGYIDLRGATDELWKYQFTSNTWTRERSSSSQWPSPRYSHSAAVFDKSMIVFGGLEELQSKNDMWLWNMAARKWTRIKCRGSPPPLFGHAAVEVGDGMLVFGGASTDGALFNHLWRFDFVSRSWSTIAPQGMISPPPRSHHAIVAIPEFLFSVLRPTSSHSAPPCTPARDRELPSITTMSDLVKRLKAKSVREKLVAAQGSLDYTEERVSYTHSHGSLGSLDSTALIEEDPTRVRLHRNNSSSLDSLIPKLEITENMSMVNHGGHFSPKSLYIQKKSFEKDNDSSYKCTDTMNSNLRDRSRVEYADSRDTRHNENIPALRTLLRQLSTSADCLFPSHGLSPAVLFPRNIEHSGVVVLMVLGGMTKRDVESYGKSVDMWKCQIDPEKKKAKAVTKIVVHSSTRAQPKPQTNSGVTYTHLDMAQEECEEKDDDESLTNDECVLMDISDGDNTSMDLLLSDPNAPNITPASALTRISV